MTDSAPASAAWKRGLGAFLGAAAIAISALAWPLAPDWFEVDEQRVVRDRHGVVLAERGTSTRGHATWVELDAVAPAVVDALVAAEDRRFRSHPGIDPLAIVRAAGVNWRHGEVVQGGSTLTQQTARLLVERPPGFSGKALEAWWALRLDAHLSKDELLTWYLNRAYFGRGAWGIEAAARSWFDESAAGLSVAEAAALVAVLPAPERLHPRVDVNAAREARDAVLDAMVQTGALGAEPAALAKAEPMQLRRPRTAPLAPHFVDRVLNERPDGAELFTTLDAEVQRDAEALVSEHIAQLEGYDIDHAAVLVVHVPTREVRAYVGSADWHADDGQVDGVVAARSPGSTLKPLLYGIAFDEGLSPATVLPDLPRRYTTTHGSWAPQNYSRSFRGPVRARDALANSYNLPAVVVLEQLGVHTLQQRLDAVGFTLEDRPEHYGLGLAIGGTSGTLEAVAGLYAGLADGGRWLPLKLQPGPDARERYFLSEQAAFQVSDILADEVARVPAFGRTGVLSRDYPSSVKTGTSTAFRDNWTVGFTDEHVVAVWVGNFDGRPMADGVSGISGAGPLWAAVTDLVVEQLERDWPTAPQPVDGVERRTYCALSGLSAGPDCPNTVEDWERSDRPPVHSCDWHQPGCDLAWPAVYNSWAAEQGYTGCNDAPAGDVAIAYPAPGAVFYVDPRMPADNQRVPLRVSAPSGAGTAVWRVDGQQVASVRPTASAFWRPQRPGAHRVELMVDGVVAPPIEVWVGMSEEQR